VPRGIHDVERLIAACDRVDLPTPARKALNLLADQLIDSQKKIDDLTAACDRVDLPTPARKALNLLADQLIDSQKKIDDLTADIRADAQANDAAQRLQI